MKRSFILSVTEVRKEFFTMRKKFAKAISAVLLMTMLSGCREDASTQMGGGLVQDMGEGAEGGALSGDISTEGEDSPVGNETGNGSAGGDDSHAGDIAAEGGGAQAAAKPDPLPGSAPEVDYIDEIYTEEENILPVTQSAAAWGISYKIENVEYTESIGDRDPERFSISGAETGSQGALQGDSKYLFLTITFTNTTDQAQEIYRTSNDISVIGLSLNTVTWSGDACYYDVDWEEGTAGEKHHWMLDPGESVTSEVGWIIEGCGSALAADDTLEMRMGSGGPYALYYHVKQYDGSNEGSYYIDLGVKAE